MADYLTHDVILNFADETPEDSTLNVLRFQARNTTLVIARSPVGKHQPLDEALTAQLDQLRNKTQALSITPAQITHLGHQQQVEGREMAVQFMTGDKPNFQLQVACLIPGQHRMLVLNYSKQGPLSDGDISHWRAIKQTLRFS
ncbi:DcrB-related protein [Pseudomonas fluorescens]|uniref:DcrB-related protein n=1 Tax=Pseudomonas fluorescens TaxID=294 RepID=UPI00192C921A|nr:DcrB-related protein [Pseudomonas fluorescens]MBL4980926.1 DcrB-related protein [Pseudomonas fluorescens]